MEMKVLGKEAPEKEKEKIKMNQTLKENLTSEINTTLIAFFLFYFFLNHGEIQLT